MRTGDREEQHQRKDQGKHQESPIAPRAQDFVSEIRQLGHESAPSLSKVNSKNASSSPAPRTSMSRTDANVFKRSRKVASESLEFRVIASPFRSTAVTPRNAWRLEDSTSGNVARMIRPPTVALISGGARGAARRR